MTPESGPAAAVPSDDRAWQASGRGDEPAYDSSPVPELADQFEVLGELGRGGSAVVYLARDLRLLRTVALKVVRLPPALPPRERRERVARLAREARTVARLEHPNIVGVYAVHELPDGLAVAMPHVRGATLKQVLAAEGALPPERAVRLVHDLAQALAHAHAEGVVHRDVKPENIFVDATTGRALLSDFGAARAGDADVRVTHTGTTVGTPAYMSPEQIDGGAIDGRADVYSLGLVAWEMLTGHRPWAGSGLYQLLHQQKHEELPPIESVRPAAAGSVPLTLQYVVERMLEKRPAARWASATAVAEQVVHPVLPPDFAHWKRALKRRLARPPASTGSGAARVATATALTEQFVPGAGGSAPGTGADGASESTSVAPGDDPSAASDALVADAPSWARPARRRRGWLVGAAALALVAAGAPLALRMREPGVRRPEPATLQVAAEARGTVEVPLLPRVPTGAPGAVDPSRSDSVPPSAAQAAPETSTDVRADAPVDAPAAVPLLPPPAPRTRNSPAPPAAGPPPAASEMPASRPAARSVSPAAAPPVAPAAAPAPRAAPAPAATASTAITLERVTVAAGGRHSCALDAAGQARCWGANDDGQLGTGDLQAYDTPVPVGGDLRFAQITTGGTHSCAVTASGEAYCWGSDDVGQLGDGAGEVRTGPARVSGPASYRAVRAGLDHTCGITTAGTVACWGANGRGQLGDGSTRSSPAPRQVAGVRGAAALAAGWRHSCALSGDGVALCWGDNADGQLGDGTRAARLAPTAVATPLRFVALAAGAAHSCALTQDGSAYCWGRGAGGTSPTRVAVPAALVSVAAGSVHTCGRTAAGAVYCWGRNTYGQLGDGTTTDHAAPVRVPGGPFRSLSATGAHTCASADGGPVCWGYNVSGQLGDGTRAHRTAPTRVSRGGA